MFEIFKDQNQQLIKETNIKKSENEKKSEILKDKIVNNYRNLKRNEEIVLSTLQLLSDEEMDLLIEKDQLLDMEEVLKQRIVTEIEAKKSKITDLEFEISRIKKRIEYLAKMLNIPVVK